MPHASDPIDVLYMSDHHTEFGEDFTDPADHGIEDFDIAVLPGDLSTGTHGVDLAAAFAERHGRPTIYMPGNHEFYGYDLDSLREKIARRDGAAYGLLHVLDDRAVTLDLRGRRVEFIGGTLWTDYCAQGTARQPIAMLNARTMMNDHRMISRMGTLFTPEEAAELHATTRAFIAERLGAGDPKADCQVVVTHHAPSLACESERYRGGELSPAFCNDMDGLIERFGPALWIHGHTHHDTDVTVGKTRIVSAQRGYPNEKPFAPGVVQI